MSILLTKAKLSLAAIAVGSCLVATTAIFAGPGFRAIARESQDGRAKQSTQEPNRSHHTNPAPWETVVRIRVLTEDAVRLCSGTVIQSSPEESLILTTAHIFKVETGLPPNPFPWKIMVDRFDGKLQDERPAQVSFVQSVEGQAVDFDWILDVGLIRIRPVRTLPASRVVPKSWQPQTGTKMLTAGCSDGNAATFWNTTIVNTNFHGLANNPSYEAIQCTVAPKQGRTGGGLFTTDGYLAGVCNFAEPSSNSGLYAAPSSIYRLLDRNGLSSLYDDQGTDSARADFVQLLREDEHLDRPAAQSSVLEEVNVLTERYARSTLQLEKLELEVRTLRDELSRLRAAARAAAGAGGKDPAANDPTVARGSPAASPTVTSARADRVSDSTSQTPNTQASAAQFQSQRSRNRSQRRPTMRSGPLIFAASPTGNKVIAHNALTQKEQSILLNAIGDNPIEVSFIDFDGAVGLNLKGKTITRTAVYDYRSGTWIPLDLSEPVSGELRTSNTQDGTVAYDVGRQFYTFNIQTNKWDHFDLDKITDTPEQAASMHAAP